MPPDQQRSHLQHHLQQEESSQPTPILHSQFLEALEHLTLPPSLPSLPNAARCEACQSTHLSSSSHCRICRRLKLCHIRGFCDYCGLCGLCAPGTCGWFTPMPLFQAAPTFLEPSAPSAFNGARLPTTIRPSLLGLSATNITTSPSLTVPCRQVEMYLQLKYTGPPLNYSETKELLLDQVLFCFDIVPMFVPSIRLLRPLSNRFHTAATLIPLVLPEGSSRSFGREGSGHSPTMTGNGVSKFTFHLRGRTTANLLLESDNVLAWAEDNLDGEWERDIEIPCSRSSNELETSYR